MQKYTKMVAGLLLIVIILSPILKLFSNDIETAIASIPSINSNIDEKNMGNLIDLQKKEIQASTDAYILEETAVQLKADVEEELMEQYGLEISDIELLVDENGQHDFPGNLQTVIVHLKDPGSDPEAVEVIKEVEINTTEPLPSNESTQESKRIVSLLSEKWDVEKEHIEVVVEGGSS